MRFKETSSKNFNGKYYTILRLKEMCNKTYAARVIQT